MPFERRNPGARRHSRIGKYEVLAHIATGGMGAVYRARDPESRREVALKILAPRCAHKPAVVERFRREALHALRLCHENIVAAHEWGEAGGTFFLALELIDGIDLDEHVRRDGPRAPEEALELVRQGSRALEHLHAHGLVHRDVKPANFLLTHLEGRPLVKLADLGLARGTGDEEARVTRSGTTVGTLDFMAPEQCRDSGRADIRSDLYSLGATWYFLLTGQPPFAEGGLGERLYQILNVVPADVRELNPCVPEREAGTLGRLLAKDPAGRHQTPAELLEDLAGPPAPRTLSTSIPVPERPEMGAGTGGGDSGPACGAAAGLFRRAREVLAAGNGEYAYRLLLTCCRLEPANIDYRQALRRALKSRLGQRGDDWLTRLGTWAAKARLKLAGSIRQDRRVLEYGEEVLAREPRHVGARLDMAAAADRLGMTGLALWLLEEARRKAPRDAPVQRALAQFHEKQGDLLRAGEYWREVARLDPSDPEAVSRAKDLDAAAALAQTRSPLSG
jgi:hypothetical protein